LFLYCLEKKYMPNFKVLLLLLVFASCSNSEEALLKQESEIQKLREKNIELLELNLALTRQMMLVDSVRAQVSLFKSTNKSLEQSSKEINKLQEEVRLLMRLNNASLSRNSSASNNEDFHLFFDRFMQDSSFQRSRIQFPLTYVYEEKDSVLSLDTLILKSSDWEYQKFYLEIAKERTQIYDNYNAVLQPNNERLVHWYPIAEKSNAINYYFQATKGLWSLIKIEKFD